MIKLTKKENLKGQEQLLLYYANVKAIA